MLRWTSEPYGQLLKVNRGIFNELSTHTQPNTIHTQHQLASSDDFIRHFDLRERQAKIGPFIRDQIGRSIFSAAHSILSLSLSFSYALVACSQLKQNRIVYVAFIAEEKPICINIDGNKNWQVVACGYISLSRLPALNSLRQLRNAYKNTF